MRKINSLLIFFFILGFNTSMAKSNLKNARSLTAKDIQKMSKTRLQLLRMDYVKFLYEMDEVQKRDPKFSGQKFSSLDQFQKYYRYLQTFYSAYAADGDICFFGGWPSKMRGPYCKKPWGLSSNPELKTFGDTYSKDDGFFCNNNNQFRCNPTLFGEGANGDSKGICVELNGSYNNLTQNCLNESQRLGNIDKLINDLQNDPEKAKALAKFDNAIFGKSGFCTKFEGEYKKKYDACEALKLRRDALMNPNVNAQVDGSPTDPAVVNPIDPTNLSAQAQSVLDKCQDLLEKNSTEDAKGRKIFETLQGGVATCVPEDILNANLELELRDIFKAAREYDSVNYLNDLNLKSFRYQLQSLLNKEAAFEDSFGDSLLKKNKNTLKEYLAKKLPQLSDKNGNQDYKDAFNEIYDKFQENKKNGLLPKIPFEEVKAQLEAAENLNAQVMLPNKNGVPEQTTIKSINKTCSDIYVKFKEKFDSKKWPGITEYVRSYSDEENEYIDRLRTQMDTSVQLTFAQNRSSFLLGTDTFKDDVLDTTVDLTKECIKNPKFRPMTPNINRLTLKEALAESRKKTLAGIKDIKQKANFVQQAKIIESNDRISDGTKKSISMNNKQSANMMIRDYLRNKKYLVMDELYSDKSTQTEKMKYLCEMTKNIYDTDEITDAITNIGGIVALGAGAACLFPLTAPVGCAVVGIATVAGATVGGARAYDGYQAGQGADLQQIVLDQQTRQAANYNEADFANERSRAAGDVRSGLTEVGLSVGGSALKPAVQGVKQGGQKLSQALKNRKVAKTKAKNQKKLAKEMNKAADQNLAQMETPEEAALARLNPNNRIPANTFEELGAIPKKAGVKPKPKNPGDEVVEYTDPTTGKSFYRIIFQKAKENGKLTNGKRKKALKKEYAGKLDNYKFVKQPDGSTKKVLVDDGISEADKLNAIYTAHKKIPCQIGKCTPKQIDEKIAHMVERGVPKKVAVDSIRKGYTGYDADAMAQIAAKRSQMYGELNPSLNAYPTKAIDLPKDSPNAGWVKAVQDSRNIEGYTVLKVERTLPDGSKIADELNVRTYLGSDGKKMLLETPNGNIALDPSDASLRVTSVRKDAGRIVNDGDGSPGKYAYAQRSMYETDPMETAQTLTGKKVNLRYLDEDGDEFDAVGQIVRNKQGNLILRSENKYANGMNNRYIETPIEKFGDIKEISRSVEKSTWVPAQKGRKSVANNKLDETFEQDTPVTIKFDQMDNYGRPTGKSDSMNGTYEGWTSSKVRGEIVQQVVIRRPDGSLKYVDMDLIDEISAKSAVIQDFIAPATK